MPPLLPICLLETGAENVPKRGPGLAVDPVVCLNGEHAGAYLCGSTDARREDGCLRAPAACTGKGRRYAEPSVVTYDIGRAGADKSVSVEGAEADPSLTPAEGSEPASHRLGHAEDSRNHRSEWSAQLRSIRSTRTDLLRSGGWCTPRRNFTHERPGR